jgi:hypothetical protein
MLDEHDLEARLGQDRERLTTLSRRQYGRASVRLAGLAQPRVGLGQLQERARSGWALFASLRMSCRISICARKLSMTTSLDAGAFFVRHATFLLLVSEGRRSDRPASD